MKEIEARKDKDALDTILQSVRLRTTSYVW